jgi:threonine synthase
VSTQRRGIDWRLGSSRQDASRAKWRVHCTACDASKLSPMPDYCWRCGSPLEVDLDYDRVRLAALFEGGVTNVWKYEALYPLSSNRHELELSLGEGGTPLVLASKVGRKIGVEKTWFKCDHLNPSGSFKDRSAAVGVAWALEQGYPGVICASSGNAAGASATYAARAGLPVYIVVSSRAPKSKLGAAAAHGARVFRVTGDFSRAFAAAREAAVEVGLANLTTTYVNCYACEGNKSVAYELYEQMDVVPDWVVVPVGSGPLLFGVWKGFEELRQFGLVDRTPRLMAVQPDGCAPIARAFETGTEVVPWSRVDTVVSGLDDPLQGYEHDGTLTLHTVRESRGVVLAVSDEDTLEAGRLLAEDEGIFVEPAAATSVAGASVARQLGHIDESASVVCLLTGHGLKYQAPRAEREPESAADGAELIRAIRRDVGDCG